MKIWFLKKSILSNSIQKFKRSDNTEKIVESIKNELYRLDMEISELTKGLLETQLTGIKTKFSRNQGFLGNIQKNWYGAAIQESTSWHQEQIFNLYKKRKSLQRKLDQLTGKFWINRIKRWVILLTVVIFAVLSLAIIFMGVLTFLYLIPVWIGVFFLYMIINRKLSNRY